MKRHQSNSRWKFTVIRLAADILVAPIVLVISYCLKFKVGYFFQNVLSLQFGKIYQQAQIEPYLDEIGVVTLIWIFTFYFVRLYQPFSGITPEVDEWVAIVKGVSIATIELMAFTFVYKSFPESRFVIAYMWIVGIVALIVVRTIIFQYELAYLRKGRGNKRAIVIGNNEMAQDIIEKLILFPTLGFNYIGTIDDSSMAHENHNIKGKIKLLGGIANLQQLIAANRPDIVIVTDTGSIFIEEIRELCSPKSIEILAPLDTSDVVTSIARIDEFDSIPVTHYYTYSPNKALLIIKDIMDRTLAGVGLILLSPLLLGIALVIKKVSPDGPVLFNQERLGLGGSSFNMIKFRTMIPNAEAATGPIMVSEKNESRYIKYGNFLRKTSLDELPQLLNVIRGEMSLVGPRPERPHFVAEFQKTIPHFHRRLLVKGGITGWAQINGRSALTNRPEYKIKYDLYYIKNWTLVLDIKILLRTIWVVFRREQAY
jgi:exopolysaccharide biosynthesis polyprenyl glycosylphosphotransferase